MANDRPKPNSPDKKGSEVDAEESEEGQAESKGGNFTSPEGILMLSIAAVLDGIGLMLFIVGTWVAIDDYGMLDIFGMVVIGGWMFARSGVNATAVKKGIRRFVTSSAIELVPFLGGASPSWVWLVYKTLKDG